MPVLRFRHHQAEQLEARARAQAEERKKAAFRQKARSEVIPPPEAQLLGTWTVIEEVIIAKERRDIVSSVEFENFHFETLSPEGVVTGKVTSQGKNTLHGKLRPGKTRAGMKVGDLEGRVLRPRFLRFLFKLALPPHYFLLNLVAGPHICEAEWQGIEMVGYEHNDWPGDTMSFRAVKVD